MTVTIALTVVGCPLRSSFEDQVAEHVGTLPGVASVTLHFDVMSPDERAALTTQLRGGRRDSAASSSRRRTRVIAVASGKGGVGKSSLTVNIAAALAALGQEVGVLDADIYGHSIPHMLGIDQKPVVVDKMIVPPVAHDLRLMSIGFFLDDNQPVMWRGPMLHRALEQFLQDVHWGELDMLVVDMPPGTGDVSISLGQLLPRAEAVVVTTPQPLAQEVASRAATMAQKTGMRVVGVVENMTSDVFGSGRRAAARDASSACRCSAASRSTPRCASRVTPACRSSLRDPDPTSARAILEVARRDRREPCRRVHAHAAARVVVAAAAAFFDLDRTLIKRSSVLALARLVPRARADLARSTSPSPRSGRCSSSLRGASAERVRSAAEDGHEDPERLLASTRCSSSSATRWRRCCARSSTRSRSASSSSTARAASASTSSRRRCRRSSQHIAEDLGFDGAIGSTCEIVDGVYTGRTLRAAHGEGKARALRELAAAEGFDLAARPRTRTPTATCRSSRRSGIRSRRTRTASCGGSRGARLARRCELCVLTRRARGSRRSASAPTTWRRSLRTSSTPTRAARLGHGALADRVARDAGRSSTRRARPRRVDIAAGVRALGRRTARSAT